MNLTTHRETAKAHVANASLVIPLVTIPILMALTLTDRVSSRLRANGKDAGVGTVDWVIIIGIVAALAIAVGVIVTQRVTDKANTLDLG